MQQTLRQLDNAYHGFFKGQTKFPNFKKKNSSKQSCQFPQDNTVDFEKSKLYVMKFREGMSCVFSRQFDGEIKKVAISKTTTGKYFASILVKEEVRRRIKRKPDINSALGIDLGLKSFIVTSENQEFDNPRFLRKSLEDHKNYTWQIMQYHRPVRPHVKSKKEMETQYKNFVPLFERYPNVRLCLENDSHTWKVTWPILSSKEKDAEEGFKRNDEKGIVYAGEGAWGAPLRAADDRKSWTRDADVVNHFNWIFVSKDKIELHTVKYENEDQVGSLTEATRFEMPANIQLYGPVNGTKVVILPRK
jgi:hypothetical protein